MIPEKLLVTLVGTERVLEKNQLITFFRAFLMTKVKTYIAQEMKSSAIKYFLKLMKVLRLSLKVLKSRLKR